MTLAGRARHGPPAQVSIALIWPSPGEPVTMRASSGLASIKNVNKKLFIDLLSRRLSQR